MAKARFDQNSVHVIVGCLALIGLGFSSWVLLNAFGSIGSTIGALAQLIWAPLAMLALVLCGGVILKGLRRSYTNED